MSIQVERTNGYPLIFDVNSFTFSGGEVQVKVAQPSQFEDKLDLKITAHLQSSDDIMELVLATDAIRRSVGRSASLKLVCPYLPYARQDRVMRAGEAHGLRVMCDIINSLNFDSVEVWDVHSDVALGLLNNVRNIEQRQFTQRIPIDWRNTVVVAPDAGAIKKALKTAQQHRVPMARADKTRSVVDGSITGTVVYSEHIGDKDFLIVDDICDGGRTFIELAKQLHPLTNGKVLLYVTHGIFSNGLAGLNERLDGIYVANPFRNVDLSHPNLTKLNLEF